MSLVALGLFPNPSSLPGLIFPSEFVLVVLVLVFVMPSSFLPQGLCFSLSYCLATFCSLLNGCFQLLPLPADSFRPQPEATSSILTVSVSLLLWDPCLVSAGDTASAAEQTA